MVPGLVLYHSAFFYNKMGYASAIGVLLFIIIFVITVINMRFIRSDIEYTRNRTRPCTIQSNPAAPGLHPAL